MTSDRDIKKRAREIDGRLRNLYPGAKTALRFSNPLELLIATILSAQCTDVRVNEVTKLLFRKYRTAKDYADVPIEELEEDIRPTGFYRNKARSLKKCCAGLVEKYSGKVPRNFDDLVKLPGVGRKTANLVIGNAYGKPSIAVDTHVRRLAMRLGLTKNKDPDKIEADLKALLPQERWFEFTYEIVDHGRAVCTARKPDCPGCVLKDICPYPAKTI